MTIPRRGAVLLDIHCKTTNPMQNTMNKMTITLVSALLMGAALSPSTLAADSDALQGKWKAEKEIEGQKVTFNLEIKEDTFQFELKGSDGEVRMFAKGKVKLEKLGPFNTLSVLDMEAGKSESELQPVDMTRSFVYAADSKTLTMASNFDRQRENQKPELTVYQKE